MPLDAAATNIFISTAVECSITVDDFGDKVAVSYSLHPPHQTAPGWGRNGGEQSSSILLGRARLLPQLGRGYHGPTSHKPKEWLSRRGHPCVTPFLRPPSANPRRFRSGCMSGAPSTPPVRHAHQANHTCGLHAWSDRVYLWSLVSAKSHMMLAHWLSHYASLGIRLASHASIVVEGTGDSVERSRSTLSRYGVSNVSFVSDLTSRDRTVVGDASHNRSVLGIAANLRHGVNAFLERLPPDAWLVWADVDEFFTWPCDANLSSSFGRSPLAFCGRMSDRISPERGMVGVTATPSISEQFPVCTSLRRNLQGTCVKVTLIRTRMYGGAVPRFVTAHTALVYDIGRNRSHTVGGWRKENCKFAGTFSHYSTTHEALRLAVVKRTDFVQRDAPAFAPLYTRILRLVLPNGRFSESALKTLARIQEPCPGKLTTPPPRYPPFA